MGKNMISRIVSVSKLAAIKLCPYLYDTIKWNYHKRLKQDGRLVAQFIKNYDLRVLNGPFSGMRYVHFSYWGRLLPKLVGSYEEELHEIIRNIIAKGFDLIVDIGSAEGYYAIGLARACPSGYVIAFEQSPYARALFKVLARKNGVRDRVSLLGSCTQEKLSAVLKDHSILISDCEGCELELLDPERVPTLKTCTMIVELHDCYNPIISSTIKDRFSHTHDVIIINESERIVKNYACLNIFKDTDKLFCVQERPKVQDKSGVGGKWAFMVPMNQGKKKQSISNIS